MQKLYEFFKGLPFQKRIVAVATIWGNTVSTLMKSLSMSDYSILCSVHLLEIQEFNNLHTWHSPDIEFEYMEFGSAMEINEVCGQTNSN